LSLENEEGRVKFIASSYCRPMSSAVAIGLYLQSCAKGAGT
jgi:hypothetical protein